MAFKNKTLIRQTFWIVFTTIALTVLTVGLAIWTYYFR